MCEHQQPPLGATAPKAGGLGRAPRGAKPGAVAPLAHHATNHPYKAIVQCIFYSMFNSVAAWLQTIGQRPWWGQCAGRAPRVAYGGADGAAPPVWRPGPHLGRCVGLPPALACTLGPFVCVASAPRPKRPKVASWWVPQLAARANKRARASLRLAQGKCQATLARQHHPGPCDIAAQAGLPVWCQSWWWAR